MGLFFRNVSTWGPDSQAGAGWPNFSVHVWEGFEILFVGILQFDRALSHAQGIAVISIAQ